MNIRISSTQFNSPVKRQQFQLALTYGLDKWFKPGTVQFSFAPNGPSALFQGVQAEEKILKEAMTTQFKNRLSSQFRPLKLAYLF